MRALLISMLAVSTALLGQQAPSNMPPNDLVRKVVNNDLNLSNADHSHWMYQSVNSFPAPAKTSIIVETARGNISYLVGMNGQPLNPEQKAAEEKKVARFVHDPAQQDRARHGSDSDSKQSSRMFAMLPNAFIFEYAGSAGPDEIKLTFHPNPNFTSHSSEAYVFHKMDGFVIVNTKEDRLVEISGRLTHRVEFAGGLLGHLDQGGTFDVRREEIGKDIWSIIKLRVNMNGKILFFKTIAEKQDEVDSHFERIPDSTTLEQAAGLAEKHSAATSAG
jgi:hypothetical protein